MASPANQAHIFELAVHKEVNKSRYGCTYKEGIRVGQMVDDEKSSTTAWNVLHAKDSNSVKGVNENPNWKTNGDVGDCEEDSESSSQGQSGNPQECPLWAEGEHVGADKKVPDQSRKKDKGKGPDKGKGKGRTKVKREMTLVILP